MLCSICKRVGHNMRTCYKQGIRIKPKIESDVKIIMKEDSYTKELLHRPKRKMRQNYLFLYILKLCFR